MKISEVMTRGVEVLRPEVTIREAAQKMAELDIGSIPILEGDQIVGFVTDRDITIKATALGKLPDEVAVIEVMTSPIIACHDDEEVERAIEVMNQNHIRRLPVLNRDNKLVGMITLTDVLAHIPAG